MDYLSPVFFEIVAPLDIAKLSAQLGKTYALKKHDEEEETLRQWIAKLKIPVVFRRDKDSSEMLPSLSAQELGHIILKLYFVQIMHMPFAWIDLRPNTFELLSKECIWKPGPWIMSWDPEFLAAIRQLYRGFYLEDSSEYQAGLKALHLEHASELFKTHFGNLDNVHFRMKDFRESFHQIFLSCKTHKTALHPNFFALGLYLSSLYEHLETLDQPYPVQDIFREILELK